MGFIQKDDYPKDANKQQKMVKSSYRMQNVMRGNKIWQNNEAKYNAVR